jgi:hypothetical protein
MNLYKHKIYCITEDVWVEGWYEETTISGCPNNDTHEVDVDSAVIVDFRVAVGPKMDDGRPLVRSDTRPIGTQTVFTMRADGDKIGDGESLRWDFSNSDGMYTPVSGSNGPTLISGTKAKQLDLVFNDPIYLKDGTIYFFDAPWGSHCSMYIVVPAGNYYPNDYGSIPASALGLSGSQMYAYANIDVYYTNYVYMHYMYGSCPMGDELNSEGCQVDAIPVGWILRGIVTTLESDDTSKGFASFELYRERTIVLPGDPLGE